MTRKPSYRFAGYTEPWEEKKLGEVSTHRSGTSIEKYFAENGVYKVISIGSYGLDGEYIDQGIRAISNEVTDKKIVKENELTMVLNDKTSNGTIIGRTLLIKSSNEFVVNQRTEIISPKEILDSQYAYVLLNGNFREQVKKIVQGGTQIYVNYSSVEQLKLPLPSLPEQTAIGSFFQDIDQLISLQQRKLEVLKEQKKTYLKLLFPAKGQTKPALRFAGFEDKWKEVKLGEVFEFSKGKGLQVDSFYEGEDNLAIAYGHLYTLYNEVITKVQRSSDNECSMYSNGNELLFPASSTVPFGTAKVVALLESGVKLGGDIIVASSDEKKVNNIFMSYNINSMKEKMYPITVGTTITHMYAKDLKELRYFLPSLPEQEAIGSFFQDLDKAIAKQEEKVNQLKESKQTLLRKMFI